MCSNNNLCFAYSISPAKFKSNRIESYRISLTFRCVQNGTASGPRYIKRIQIQSSCPFPFPFASAFAVPHFESMLSIIYGHIQTYFPNLLPCREGELGRSSVVLRSQAWSRSRSWSRSRTCCDINCCDERRLATSGCSRLARVV